MNKIETGCPWLSDLMARCYYVMRALISPGWALPHRVMGVDGCAARRGREGLDRYSCVLTVKACSPFFHSVGLGRTLLGKVYTGDMFPSASGSSAAVRGCGCDLGCPTLLFRPRDPEGAKQGSWGTATRVTGTEIWPAPGVPPPALPPTPPALAILGHVCIPVLVVWLRSRPCTAGFCCRDILAAVLQPGQLLLPLRSRSAVASSRNSFLAPKAPGRGQLSLLSAQPTCDSFPAPRRDVPSNLAHSPLSPPSWTAPWMLVEPPLTPSRARHLAPSQCSVSPLLNG